MATTLPLSSTERRQSFLASSRNASHQDLAQEKLWKMEQAGLFSSKQFHSSSPNRAKESLNSSEKPPEETRSATSGCNKSSCIALLRSSLSHQPLENAARLGC